MFATLMIMMEDLVRENFRLKELHMENQKLIEAQSKLIEKLRVIEAEYNELRAYVDCHVIPVRRKAEECIV